MKNKKVEELVEWVAEYLYDDMCGSGCHGGAGWGQTYKDDATEDDKEEYRGYARSILSHPDLALIDREAVRECADEDGVIRRYKDTKYIILSEVL